MEISGELRVRIEKLEHGWLTIGREFKFWRSRTERGRSERNQATLVDPDPLHINAGKDDGAYLGLKVALVECRLRVIDRREAGQTNRRSQ